MIIRRRKKPLVLQKLEAAMPRLPKHFPRMQEIQQEIGRRYKGFIGEQRVDYHLEILAPQFTIIQDVCLKVQGRKFQIDSIIITNHAIFCIESKNYDGTITFNTILKQFTRNHGKIETGYRYPITQAETNAFHLRNWLQEHNFHNIPIHYFIAISYPSTIINVIGDEESIARAVAHGEHIPQMVIHTNDKITGNAGISRHHIGRAILKECIEYDFDILQTYGIKNSEFITGVCCRSCRRFGMKRIHSNWTCTNCNHRNKNAHIRAITEYLLLIKPWITNQECMRFLNISSRNVATRLLKASSLIYEPKYRRWKR